MRLPGTVATSIPEAVHHKTRPQTHPGGVRQPVKIIVARHISVLAYQFVQIILKRLAAREIHDSWTSLRNILKVQPRVTSSFKMRTGRRLSVRKAS
jgi:hypothetical protein